MRVFYFSAIAALLLAAASAQARTITPESPEEAAMLQQADKKNTDGASMLQRGEYGIAEIDFRSAIAIWPQDSIAYQGLAEALAGLGKRDEAIAAYRALIYAKDFTSSTAGEARTLLGYAVLLNEARDWPEAVATYEKGVAALSLGFLPKISIKFTRDNPQPTMFAAAARLALGYDAIARYSAADGSQENGALDQLRHAVKLEPNWDVARFYYAFGLMKAGKAKEAIPAFNSIFDLNPSSQIRYALKLLYGVVGRLDPVTGRTIITPGKTAPNK